MFEKLLSYPVLPKLLSKYTLNQGLNETWMSEIISKWQDAKFSAYFLIRHFGRTFVYFRFSGR